MTYRRPPLRRGGAFARSWTESARAMRRLHVRRRQLRRFALAFIAGVALLCTLALL